MTDAERAAWMTPPPDLVRGCDTPEGLRVLADWLDDHGGDGAEFREQVRGVADRPLAGEGDGRSYGYLTGDGSGDGDVNVGGNGFGDGELSGYGRGYGNLEGDNNSYLDGDGGPDSPN